MGFAYRRVVNHGSDAPSDVCSLRSAQAEICHPHGYDDTDIGGLDRPVARGRRGRQSQGRHRAAPPLDPLSTITNLSNNVDVPVGAIVHYVLCRWASEGSNALLELGPRMVRRLQEPFETAEVTDTDEARLAAYEQVRQMVAWLNFPLAHPEVYDDLNE